MDPAHVVEHTLSGEIRDGGSGARRLRGIGGAGAAWRRRVIGVWLGWLRRLVDPDGPARMRVERGGVRASRLVEP